MSSARPESGSLPVIECMISPGIIWGLLTLVAVVLVLLAYPTVFALLDWWIAGRRARVPEAEATGLREDKVSKAPASRSPRPPGERSR